MLIESRSEHLTALNSFDHLIGLILNAKEDLLVTGGCGIIGSILKPALEKRYTITCLDTRKTEPKCVIADITNLSEIEKFFENTENVIHLAAASSLQADWESVYSANILGTYNVFEAARKYGTKRVIFASSNHVTGLYERDWPISSIVQGNTWNLDPSKIPMVTHLSPPRPDSLYGASKLFGEGLGQYYSNEYGIKVICLRIGTVRSYNWPMSSEKRFFSTWLSHRDLIQLVEKALVCDSISYDVFYGVSNNKWRYWDVSHGKEVIQYEPKDNADEHR